MGNYTKNSKKENSRRKVLSLRRKNRRLAILRSISASGEGTKNNEVHIDETNITENLDVSVIGDPSVMCRDKIHIEVQGSEEFLSTETPSTSKDITSENFSPTGRRIFDVSYLFKQILSSGRHEPFDCTIVDMTVTREVVKGLKSTFYLKCTMCGITQTLCNEEFEDKSKMDINSAMTMATISVGIGYSQIEEIAAAINMPMMSQSTYIIYHDRMHDVVFDTAWKLMAEAGQEEAKLARDRNDVDEDGIPYITVVTDGAWSKRSYNVNYDAASGVGCIIGLKTGKLLYLGIRNKYCCVCARAKDSNNVPTHTCFKNWSGTSTGMESDIIVEGFKTSVHLHGLKYLRMVGDGDSSVYRKICQTKPYSNQLVEKVECRNHLLRNFLTKLRDIIG